VISLFMALLSSRGIDTQSLQARGEQRRSIYFNNDRDIPRSLGYRGPTGPSRHSSAFQLTNLLQNFFHLRRGDGAQSLSTEIALLEDVQRERG
jgi:hypothetical protein